MPHANPYDGHVRSAPAYPDCDSDTDDAYKRSVSMLSMDESGDFQCGTTTVSGTYQWARPGPDAQDFCGASSLPLHPALDALNRRMAKVPASVGDCTPQVFGDVLDGLRALREAATPPARSKMMQIVYQRTANVGEILLDWASSDIARARMVEALKASSQEEVADAMAATFMAAMRGSGADREGARFTGAHAVLREIRPDAEAVKRSLDRAEDRGEDGRAPRQRVANAMRSWRSDTARHPAICRMMAEEIGLRA